MKKSGRATAFDVCVEIPKVELLKMHNVLAGFTVLIGRAQGRSGVAKKVNQIYQERHIRRK